MTPFFRFSEDPIGFSAGDANLNRYVFNSPLTHSDPSGNSLFSSLWDKGTNAVQDLAHDVGDFFEDIGVTKLRDIVNDNLSDAWDWVEEAAHDTGDFFEEQWENGNIQKALLAASVVFTVGTAAPLLFGVAGTAGLFTGGAVTVGTVFAATTATISAAASSVAAYEAFTGDQVGGRDFSRILGGVALVTGGVSGLARAGGALSTSFRPTFANITQVTADGLHGAAELAGGYEQLSGRPIGDGTFSNVMFGASSIAGGVTTASRPGVWNKFTGGLSATTGSLSIAASLSGNQQMANALRVATISNSLANLGTSTYQIGAGVWGLWSNRTAGHASYSYAGDDPGYDNSSNYGDDNRTVIQTSGSSTFDYDPFPENDGPLTSYDTDAELLRAQEKYQAQLQFDSLTDFGSATPSFNADMLVGPPPRRFELSDLPSDFPSDPFAMYSDWSMIFYPTPPVDSSARNYVDSLFELTGPNAVSGRVPTAPPAEPSMSAEDVHRNVVLTNEYTHAKLRESAAQKAFNSAWAWSRNDAALELRSAQLSLAAAKRTLEEFDGRQRNSRIVINNSNDSPDISQVDAFMTGYDHGRIILANRLALGLSSDLTNEANALIQANRHLGYQYADGAAVVAQQAIIGALTGGFSNQTQALIASGKTISGTRALVQGSITVYESYQTGKAVVGVHDAYQQGDWGGVALNGLGIVGGASAIYMSGRATATIFQTHRPAGIMSLGGELPLRRIDVPNGTLKSSETIGRQVEATYRGRKMVLRVDIEPGGKLQIQAGRGKNSIVDFRPDLTKPLGKQIDDFFKRLPQSTREILKNNAQKGLDRLRETGNI